MIIGLHLFLLIAAVALSIFSIIHNRGQHPIDWAVLCLSLALVLR